MTKPVSRLTPGSRLARASRAAALGLLVAGSGIMTSRAVPSAPIVSVQANRVADLVVLGRGYDAGLRQGMVCRVTRGPAEIAEVILVDLRPTCSAALIVSLAPRQSIRAGDVASIKILKS